MHLLTSSFPPFLLPQSTDNFIKHIILNISFLSMSSGYLVLIVASVYFFFKKKSQFQYTRHRHYFDEN